MVQITVVGVPGVQSVEYKAKSKVRKVKQDLRDSYGPGMLTRSEGEARVSVLERRLVDGNYYYHVTPAPVVPKATSFDDSMIDAMLNRLGKRLSAPTHQYSPLPPTSFSAFANTMYTGVNAENPRPVNIQTYDTAGLTEEQVNAQIKPVLAAGSEVQEHDIVLINTERYTWLPCTGDEMNDLKPDFVVIHRAFFVPVKGAPELTGRVHSQFVDQVLSIKEGKITVLNGESKGRLLRYLYHLDVAGMNEVKGMLFNGSNIHYVWMTDESITRVVESAWSDDSVRLLRECNLPYKYPPLTEALIKLCAQFRVRADSGTAGAVLGKGGSGCAFRVRDIATGALFALKVVVGDIPRLRDEVHYMKIAHARAPHAVVNIVGDAAEGDLDNEPDGKYAGYLMTEVGEPINRLSQRLGQVFGTLQSLHARKIAHRDARIQNIVQVPTSTPETAQEAVDGSSSNSASASMPAPVPSKAKHQLKFIDFRASAFDTMCTMSTYRTDVQSLVDSIFKLVNVPATAQEAINIASTYDATEAGARCVAKAVMRKWQTFILTQAEAV